MVSEVNVANTNTLTGQTTGKTGGRRGNRLTKRNDADILEGRGEISLMKLIKNKGPLSAKSQGRPRHLTLHMMMLMMMKIRVKRSVEVTPS